MVREGLSNKMTFEQRQKGVREQARWRSGGRGLAVKMP